MNKLKKTLLYLLLVPTGLAILGDFCQKQTKGFRLYNIFTFEQTPSPSITDPNSAEAKTILQQPFFFLKKGQQCFVFISKDKKYVLKFLRADKIAPPYWTSLLPASRTKHLRDRLQKKRESDFASYQIAYQELKQETGLVYLQLGNSPSLQQELTIYDNIGVIYHLPLNNVAFLLQKTTEDFYPHFIQALENRQEESLYPFLTSLASVLQERVQKGISDSDITLEYNMGMTDGTPVLFDVGNLQIKGDKISIDQEASLLLASLHKKSPKLALFFEEKLHNKAREEPY